MTTPPESAVTYARRMPLESLYDAMLRKAAWHRATASVHTHLSVQFSSKWTPEMRAAEKAIAEMHFRAAEKIERRLRA